MSNKLNISVLVAARDEYIEQLKCIVTPLILQGFNSIYSDSVKITNGKRVLYKFQELLKEIPKWNQTILQEESKRIKKKCPYIMDIVTAIFVSNVKILASIRLKGKNDNIKVKIPTSDIFIHSIYIESAQSIFYNPYLFNGNIHSNEQNKKELIYIIRTAVDETIRQMLPFDEILQEYLVNALDDNADKSSGTDSSESSDSDDSEDDYLKGDNIVNNSELDDEDYDDANENNEHKSEFIDGESDNSDDEVEEMSPSNPGNLSNPVGNPAGNPSNPGIPGTPGTSGSLFSFMKSPEQQQPMFQNNIHGNFSNEEKEIHGVPASPPPPPPPPPQYQQQQYNQYQNVTSPQNVLSSETMSTNKHSFF